MADSALKDRIQTLLADEKIRKALAFIEADQDAIIEEIKEMVVIQGAPFHESEERSPMYRDKLAALGLRDCVVDSEDNAIGFYDGTRPEEKVLLEAHLDTVFAKETPLAVNEKDGKLYCPGISDDTAGLGVVLSLIRAMKHAGIKPVRSLIMGGTSGEEGEGDIRGIKALLRQHKDIVACLALEPGAPGILTKGAVGSKRYEFVFTGPGGHSWNAYGLPSPLHAACRAVAKMADVTTGEDPKTTYTVGVIEGGTSVNSIAHTAKCKLDMRSVCSKALAELEEKMLPLVDQAVAEENAFRKDSGQSVQVVKNCIGDRPAGEQDVNAPIVAVSVAAHEALDVIPEITPPSSTNANAPISQGIPAIVLRTGSEYGNIHALDEWFDPKGMDKGAKGTLLTLLAVAGVDGLLEPLPL